MTRHNEFAMYFVGNDPHAVAHANVVHLFKFLARPHTSRGIVRIAEKKNGGLVVGALAFKIFEIYSVSVALSYQFVFHNLASLIAYA